MAKRIIVVIVVVLVILGVTSYAYSHYRDRRIGAGEVIDEGGAALGSNDSGQVKSAARADAAGNSTDSSTDGGSGEGPTAPAKRGGFSAVTPATVTPVQSPMNSAPTTDTIAPNPPNGTVFAGTGKFQVYRQGDLTWRVNTADGSTCILFATEEQWRRPVVYQHGCAKG